MTVFGVVGTGQFLQGQRPTDYLQNVIYLRPNGMVPITALKSLSKPKPTTDPEYSWRTIDFEARHLTVNGAVADVTATSVTVDAKSFMAPKGTVIRNARTGELFRVTADPSVDTGLTLSRAFAGSTATAILDNDQLTIIATAFEEGSSGPKATNRRGTKFRNFTQIFKEAVEITNTAQATKTSSDDLTLADQKMQALDRHAMDMERTFLWGRPSETVGPDGNILRTTAGLLYYLDGTDTSVDYNEDAGFQDIDDYMQMLFAYGGDTRLGFCGNKFLSRLNRIIRDEVNYSYNGIVNIYGYDFQRVRTPFGEIGFRTHPLLTTDPSQNNAAVIIAPEHISMRTLRATNYLPNQQSPGVDAKMDQWVTELGYEIHFPQCHGYIRNL